MIENLVHQPLVGCSSVFEIKRHYPVEVVGIVRDKGGFVHVKCGHVDLVVPGICIQKAKYFVPCCAVNESVDVG